jgi:hypothetical protein
MTATDSSCVKTRKVCFKVWAICGANRYRFSFNLWCGKDPTNCETDDLLLGSDVLLNMLDCADKPNSHCAFFDNFSTNQDILMHLRQLGY